MSLSGGGPCPRPPVQHLLLAIIFPLLACGPESITDTELISQAEFYSSRATFSWQNTEVFQLRGNCRLEDESLVARGPFVLWGSAADTLLRGDFYGPDGGPVVSFRADPTGMTVYLPEEEYASFSPLGLIAGEGVLPTIHLIHMLRTGFPMALEPWMICEGAVPGDGAVTWTFTVPPAEGSSDTMRLLLENGSLFPSVCVWTGGELRILAASPHDEYSAWPWRWETEVAGSTVELELTHIRMDAVPWEGIWDLSLPVEVDSAQLLPAWAPAWEIPVR